MKKVTLLFGLFLIIFTTFAQKPVEKPYNKKANEELIDHDGRYQVNLDRDEKFVLTSVKRDTTWSVKNGHPVREIMVTTTTATIRKGEVGIFEWETDNMGWATFATVEKQGLRLPFITSASGSGNTSNNMVLMTDTACGTQINGDIIPCKPSARIITLGSAEDEDLATYTFEGSKPKLMYQPIFKEKEKKVKVKSNGKKVSK